MSVNHKDFETEIAALQTLDRWNLAPFRPSGAWTMLEDRTTAGKNLSDVIREEDIPVDLVMTLPPGGVLVGETIARERNIPLDIVVSHPLQDSSSRVEFGAVATDGTLWIENDVMEEQRISEEQVHQARDRALALARLKLKKYRGHREPELAGKHILLVGDGTESDSLVMACAGQLLKSKARSVSIATPVVSRESRELFESVADHVVTLASGDRPASSYYGSLPAVSDDEIARQFDPHRPLSA